jgi:hypothetical protein
VLRQFSIEPHGIIRWRLDGTKKTVPWILPGGLDQTRGTTTIRKTNPRNENFKL